MDDRQKQIDERFDDLVEYAISGFAWGTGLFIALVAATLAWVSLRCWQLW